MKYSLALLGPVVILAAAAGFSCSSTTATPSDAGSGDGSTAADSGAGTDASVDSNAGNPDTGGNPDAGGGTDTGASADTSVETGPATLPLNGCTTTNFIDRSAAAASRTINGPTSTIPAQYNPPCMIIKVGQTVTFTTALFSQHPLEASGGDIPTPITTPPGSSSTIDFTFPKAGLYGFDCGFHPLDMQGVVQVIP